MIRPRTRKGPCLIRCKSWSLIIINHHHARLVASRCEPARTVLVSSPVVTPATAPPPPPPLVVYSCARVWAEKQDRHFTRGSRRTRWLYAYVALVRYAATTAAVSSTCGCGYVRTSTPTRAGECGAKPCHGLQKKRRLKLARPVALPTTLAGRL